MSLGTRLMTCLLTALARTSSPVRGPSCNQRRGWLLIVPLFLSCVAAATPARGTYWTYEVHIRDVSLASSHQYTATLTVAVLHSAVLEDGSGLAIAVVTYGMIADRPEASTGHVLQVFGDPPARWPFLTLAVPGTYAGGYVGRAMSGLLWPPWPGTPAEPRRCVDGWVKRPGMGIVLERVCIEKVGEDMVSLPQRPVKARVLRFSALIPEEDHKGTAWWVADLSGWARVVGQVRSAGGFCSYEIHLVDHGYFTADKRSAFLDRLGVLLGSPSLDEALRDAP